MVGGDEDRGVGVGGEGGGPLYMTGGLKGRSYVNEMAAFIVIPPGVRVQLIIKFQ